MDTCNLKIACQTEVRRTRKRDTRAEMNVGEADAEGEIDRWNERQREREMEGKT